MQEQIQRQEQQQQHQPQQPLVAQQPVPNGEHTNHHFFPFFIILRGYHLNLSGNRYFISVQLIWKY